jgi:hypothetical protein
LILSGSVTVLLLAALGQPEAAAAQAIGTMQVSATVVPAEASWSGFSGAQTAAQELAGSPAAGAAGFDVPFARVEVAPPGEDPDRRTVSIHYLLN